MNDLLRQIEATQSLPGWCTLHKAQYLASLVVGLRPELSLETGVFGGRSFLPLALAHKFIGKGAVIGIEPWSKEAAAEGYAGENKLWWGERVDFGAIKRACLKSINSLDVQSVCQVHQIKSDDYTPTEIIGVCHLDSQHTEQAMREVRKFAPKMMVGGVMVLDDIHWKNDSDLPVERAANWLLENGFREIYRINQETSQGKDDWGAFQRIK